VQEQRRAFAVSVANLRVAQNAGNIFAEELLASAAWRKANN